MFAQIKEAGIAKKKKKKLIGSPVGFPWQPYLVVHSLKPAARGMIYLVKCESVSADKKRPLKKKNTGSSPV